jgi:DDE family transposase/transposase-like protein DUF772
MSLPKLDVPAVPTTMELDLEALYPAEDRYRIFAEVIYPVLVQCREEYAEAYVLDNGRAGVEPVWLAGVGLLQFIDRVPDRGAVEMLRYHAGWNLALRRCPSDPLFDRSVLSCFRDRVIEHEQSGLIFQRLLDELIRRGLVKRRSKQRLDGTQMWGLVREMSWLDCVRESLRLALEELEGHAHLSRPAFWTELWREYVESKPDYKAGSEVLARKLEEAGLAAWRLLDWVGGLCEAAVAQGQAVTLLRRVLDEHFEVVGQAAGVQPRKQLAGERVHSPHEPEAHYAVKGHGKQKQEHVGYKVQVAESAEDQELAPGEPTRQFLTGIGTQSAEESDQAGAEQMDQQQAGQGLEKPPVKYVDGAYVSAQALAEAHAEGRQLVGPAQMPAPLSGGRFTVAAFQVRVEERKAVCPAGQTNTQCSRLEHQETGEVIYRFEWTTHCAACPLRDKCLQPEQSHRQIQVGQHHDFLQARRQEQKTEPFKKECQKRNGIEGTISELKRGHGLGQARYRGKARVTLQNYFIGAACNIKRWIRRIIWALRRGQPSQQPALPGVPGG